MMTTEPTIWHSPDKHVIYKAKKLFAEGIAELNISFWWADVVTTNEQHKNGIRLLVFDAFPLIKLIDKLVNIGL